MFARVSSARGHLTDNTDMTTRRTSQLTFVCAVSLILVSHAVVLAKPVTEKQARSIAGGFLQGSDGAKLRLTSSNQTRPNWTIGPRYRFEIPLDAKDPANVYHAKCQVLVDRSTGRVVEYHYFRDAFNHSKPVDKSQMIGEEKARESALKLLKKAGVDPNGMKLQSVEFHDYGHREGRHAYQYFVTFAKIVSRPGVGEVELPVRADFELDAVTGKLMMYYLYDMPLKVPVVPPVVSRERAIQIARSTVPTDQVKLYGEIGTADAKLVAGVPSGRMLKDEQHLHWCVVLHRRNSDEGGITISVDAITGNIVSALFPIGA